MQPFTTHTGRAVSLRRSNVDTDQIIPAEYLKRVSRSGFADGLFAAWRADPSFVLNQPHAAGATILLAGPDFGIGSSREHAVWALADYGFRVVAAARFGDIFYNNAIQGGLLPVRLPAETVAELQDIVETDPATQITVDLAAREVRAVPAQAGQAAATGQRTGAGPQQVSVPFEIDDYTRWRLMEGLDDISLTLRRTESIARYERGRPGWLPVAG
jgi:3-isopropylmalate/(R)-2-methylmalate dehydratase small subunit